MQLSQSGRVVTAVAVSQGVVYKANAGDTSWTAATSTASTTPALNSTGAIFSTADIGKLWFCDGTHYRVFDPAANTVVDWTATSGSLPIDGSSNVARLICTWRGRIVLSGVIGDPNNWFMSKVSQPQNWNYAPTSVTPDQAIAGNNAPQGLLGDIITCLVPYTDDVLIMGGDHSIHMMAGDPMAGGQIDLVSDSIGMAWGIPWCKDPLGTVYFVSNRTGIYSLVPGQAPQRISQGIEQDLADINMGSNSVRMVWNERFQGFHVFITPTSAAAATTHYFHELRNGAWWKDTFNNTSQNPIACVQFDGNNPGDRVVLLGSWDGYVRYLDHNAATDDTRPIVSSVVIGPILTSNTDDMLLHSLQCVLGADSGDVTYKVRVGETAEQALEQDPVMTGTWTGGRNVTEYIRRSGHVIYLEITSENQWRMEQIRARVNASGKVRMRMPASSA